MITYVKVVSKSGISDPLTRDGLPGIFQFEAVLKEFEHLFKNDNHRAISTNCAVCDAIEVFRDRDDFIQVTAIVGKTRRVFHFNNVLWTEVDESEA